MLFRSNNSPELQHKVVETGQYKHAQALGYLTLQVSGGGHVTAEQHAFLPQLGQGAD
jgi:hypothetical protein